MRPRWFFDAGIPLTFLSLDITHQVLTTPARLDALRQIGNPVSEIAAAVLSHYGKADAEKTRHRGRTTP